MICLIALLIFAVLGIFSVGHRKLAREAFDCVFRKLTLRKCESRLDDRLKSSISGKIIGKNPILGSLVYRRFEILSWVFTILMIGSMIYSGYGVYNFIKYGNCNGEDGGFCIYDIGTGCVDDDCEEGCECGDIDCEDCEDCENGKIT